MMDIRKIRVKYSFLGTLVLSIAANAYAYFNFMPRHDSINHAMYFAGDWEISLGRFLLPLYGKIRGQVMAPWLLGLLSIIFITVSAYMISSLLDMKKPWLIFVSAGFLSANYTITETCGTFLHTLDSYMLSLCFACAGVYAVRRIRQWKGIILGGAAFILSLGLYQSYITVALLLFIIVAVKDLSEAGQKWSWKDELYNWLRWIISLGIGGGGYFIIYKAVLKIKNISAANSYNSLSGIWTLSLSDIVNATKQAYVWFVQIFFCKQQYNSYLAIGINILLMSAAIIVLFVKTVKMRGRRGCLVRSGIVLLGVSVMPFAAFLICIMMNYGSIYFLTCYALFVIYPFCLQEAFDGTQLLWHKDKVNAISVINDKLHGNIAEALLFGLSVCLLFSSVCFSNRAYMVQKYTYDRTLSVMTRVVSAMENTSGYIPGETPVICVGRLADSDSNISEFGAAYEYSVLKGNYKTSVTYPQTYASFIKFLGDPVNMITDSTQINEYSEKEEVQAMPIFPESGYCQMLDGVLVMM